MDDFIEDKFVFKLRQFIEESYANKRLNKRYIPLQYGLSFYDYDKNIQDLRYIRFFDNPLKDILCVESAFFNRNTQYANDYKRLLLGNGCKRTMSTPILFPGEEYNKSRLDKFDINLPERSTSSGKNILIALQTPQDASIVEYDHYVWAAITIKRIRELTEDPIVLIKHPGLFKTPGWHREDHKGTELLEALSIRAKNCIIIPANDEGIVPHLKDAKCVVVCTSSSAIEASLAGVPCVALDKDCFMYPAVNTNLSVIQLDEVPFDKDEIHKQLCRLSFCQWAFDEVENYVLRLEKFCSEN